MLCFLVVAGVAAGCDSAGLSGTAVASRAGVEAGGTGTTSMGFTPLTDFAQGLHYFGNDGGLYPDGNLPTGQHHRLGLKAAGRIRPLDANGAYDPVDGRIVVLSVGMSNVYQEYCGVGARRGSGDRQNSDCQDWSFVGQAEDDPAVDRAHLTLVNGARPGEHAERWATSDHNYETIAQRELAPRGLSPRQVQVVWLKQATLDPATALPAADADAYALQRHLGDIARRLKAHYPNLQQIFLSSRIYAGYATTKKNPEPYAYESGFAVKWVIEGQIEQHRTGLIDAHSGDLHMRRGAPWLAWGPYTWADGLSPRSDGLTWSIEEFQNDGTHPSELGQRKVGTMLLDFFKTSPYTACWFLAEGVCG